MDRAQVWDVLERVQGLAAGATTIAALAVADRAGVLDALRESAPMAVGAIAEAHDFDERHLEELLRTLVTAGLLEHADERFHLPEHVAAVIADDDSPYAMTGWFDLVPALVAAVDGVAAAVRGERAGVPMGEYDDRAVKGIGRLNGPGLRILLARRWLRTMPDVVERLEAGGRVADLGCGSGDAVLAMADAYPDSEVVGYDLDERAVAAARERIATAGLDNASVEQASAADIEGPFDLITAFDVVHDLAAPRQVLATARAALADDGVLLVMEPDVPRDLDEASTAHGQLMHGVSLLHCMTQSRAAGGPGLGAVWGRDAAVELCRDAGFGTVEVLPIEHPFSFFLRAEA